MTWRPGVWDQPPPRTAPPMVLRVHVNGVPYVVEVEPVWQPPQPPDSLPWPLPPGTARPQGAGPGLAPLPGAIPPRPPRGERT